MGSHLAVITSEAEQVGAGLRGAQQPATQCQALEGTQIPSAPTGEWGCPFCSPSAPSPLCPSPIPWGPTPPPSPQSCTSWTLCFFQEFLYNLAKGAATNAYETKYYIGLSASGNGQWQWVDQTPYEKAAT